MSKYFANPNERLQNGMKFVLNPSVSKEAVERKIKQLEERNLKRNKALKRKQMEPVTIKHDPIQAKWNNPNVHSVSVPSTSQEVSELMRMAKVLAYKTREKFGIGEKYSKEIDNFMREYSGKISQYNLYTKLGEIFNNFRNPNYTETMFDKNYLGTNASSDYIKSLETKLIADKKAKEAVDMFGGIEEYTGLKSVADIVGGHTKPYAVVSVESQIKKHNLVIADLNSNMDSIRERITILQDEKDLLLKTTGEVSMASPEDVKMIEDEIVKLQAEYVKLSDLQVKEYEEIAKKVEERRTMRTDEMMKRREEAKKKKDAEAEAKKKKDAEDEAEAKKKKDAEDEAEAKRKKDAEDEAEAKRKKDAETEAKKKKDAEAEAKRKKDAEAEAEAKRKKEEEDEAIRKAEAKFKKDLEDEKKLMLEEYKSPSKAKKDINTDARIELGDMKGMTPDDKQKKKDILSAKLEQVNRELGVLVENGGRLEDRVVAMKTELYELRRIASSKGAPADIGKTIEAKEDEITLTERQTRTIRTEARERRSDILRYQRQIDLLDGKKK